MGEASFNIFFIENSAGKNQVGNAVDAGDWLGDDMTTYAIFN